MTCVLIKVYGGIVDEVVFFEDHNLAVKDLACFVREMNPQNDDAWVFSPDGMIANAKTFLGDNDEFIQGIDTPPPQEPEESLYVIGNPNHHLGFMIASMDDPLAYRNPVEAISELGYMRKDFGRHLKLYRLVQVIGFMATRKDLQTFNAKSEIDDFDYSLVGEYLIPGY
jgi:hypothetical protein